MGTGVGNVGDFYKTFLVSVLEYIAYVLERFWVKVAYVLERFWSKVAYVLEKMRNFVPA